MSLPDALFGYRDQLERIGNEWDQAERLIKQAELVRGKVVWASINELRYGGRRLVDALLHLPSEDMHAQEANLKEFGVLVSETLQFCQRAQHDAIDATVLYVQQALKAYVDEFGVKLVAESFPNYFEMVGYIAEANQLIALSREERKQRQAIYAELAERVYPDFLRYYNQLKSGRDLFRTLSAAQIKQKGEAQKEAAWARFRDYAFPIITLILGAIIGHFVPFWFSLFSTP
ncbi:MAG: hypothetical protein RL186_95 [Pseudomonadota bacterium]|jgi:tRNA nucleotidyltransferase/poly(A) polymerase